jgi:hypothetical protein
MDKLVQEKLIQCLEKTGKIVFNNYKNQKKG